MTRTQAMIDGHDCIDIDNRPTGQECQACKDEATCNDIDTVLTEHVTGQGERQ